MSIPLYQVDAFTSRPFAGNPAAVCLLNEAMPDEWMQDVAREMNLSETAFLVPQADGYLLRWFTPAVEVILCGHATLASAHVLWESGTLKAGEQARFHTKSGLLTAVQKAGWIELDFPSRPTTPVEALPKLAEALGAALLYVGKNIDDYMVEVDSEEIVRKLRPDFTALAALPVRGVIVTSRAASAGYDFVSRFFAPAAGVNEDPVTGSAHTCLTPYWAEKLGKTELSAFQASPRGGILRVCLAGERVLIAGQAVTVFKGELLT